jgi:hypothetical protein
MVSVYTLLYVKVIYNKRKITIKIHFLGKHKIKRAAAGGDKARVFLVFLKANQQFKQVFKKKIKERKVSFSFW